MNPLAPATSLLTLARLSIYAFFWLARIGIILLICGILILCSSAGTKLCLHALGKYLQIDIQTTGVKGTVFTGVKIEKINLDQRIQLHNVHLKWDKIQQLSLTLKSESANIPTPIEPQLMTQLQQYLPSKPPQLPTITDAKIKFNLRESLIPNQINFNFLNTPYQIEHLEKASPQKFRLLSPQNQQANIDISTRKITIQGNVSVERVSLKVNGDINPLIQQAKLELSSAHSKIEIDYQYPQNHHQLNFNQTSPQLESNLHASINNDHLQLKANANINQTMQWHDFNLDKTHLHIEADGKASSPQLNINYQSDKTQWGDWHAHAVSIQHQQSSPNQSSTIAQTTQILKGQQIILNDSQTAIKRDHAAMQINISSPSQPHLKIQAHAEAKNQWDLWLTTFQLNENAALVDTTNPILARIDKQHLTLKNISQQASTPPLELNLNYNFKNDDYHAKIKSQQLPIQSLPINWQSITNLGITHIQGIVDSDLQINGNSKKQTINGHIQANIPKAQIHELLPQLPIMSDLDISQAQISCDIKNNQLITNGKMQANNGNIELIGHSDINKALNLSLDIDAEQLNFPQTQNGFINLDTKLKINHRQQTNHTSGTVMIKKANYHNNNWKTMQTLPDETVITQPNSTAEKKSRQEYSYDLTIELGEDIQIHAFGLHGQLQGMLNLQKQHLNHNMGQGKIQLNKGILLIYGQQLPLTQAEMHWFNSPIDNPNINMKIEKQHPGAHSNSAQNYQIDVSGPLDNLTIGFASSPEKMSNMQILTHLLTDKRTENKEYTESIDNILINLNYHQVGGNDLSKVVDILTALKKATFFDHINFSNTLNDNPDQLNQEGIEVTLTRLLNEKIAINLTINDSDPKKNQLGLDALLSENLTLRSFYQQNRSSLGFELYFQENK